MSHKLTGLHDVISPTALNFNYNNISFGEQVANILVIIDYPPIVGAGWFAKVAQLPGVVCTMHMTPTDSYSLLKQISKIIKKSTYQMLHSKNAFHVKRAEETLHNANDLFKKIDQEKQQVFYFSAILMILANDFEELKKRTQVVEAQLASCNMRGRVVMYKQEEGLVAVGPWAILPNSIAEVCNRNMPAETVAASFPFTVSGINDGSGFILGRDRNGGVVLVDVWKRGHDRANSNWIVLGKPGVGKSTAVKKILTNSFAQGARVIVIDPEREYKDLCVSLGGAWINVGGDSGGRINPLQAKAVPKDSTNDSQIGSLANHFQTLRTFFSLYIKEVSELDLAYLEEVLEELYNKFNISWLTNTATIDPQKWPTINDLYTLLAKKAEKNNKYEVLAMLIRKAALGADASLFNGHTTLSSTAKFIVLDTFALQESSIENRRAQLFNVLSWAWNEVVKNRDEKIVLAIDEAYLLADPSTPEALQFLRNTSKRIRKYEGALIPISQNINDFLDLEVARYGQSLLDNPTYKLIMGLGEKDLQALTQLMHLSEAEVDLLSQGVRGEALLVAGSKRIYTKIELAEHEYELFGRSGGR